MTSLFLLLALTTPGQTGVDEEKRQVYEIQLERRLDGLDDRTNHADADYLDIMFRAAAPIDPDKLVQSREEFRLRAENSRLPYDRDGYVSYRLALKRLADEYAEVARDLDGIGRTALADHARRQGELWAERADAIRRSIEQSKAESERIVQARQSRESDASVAQQGFASRDELAPEAQVLREKVNPIFRLFRFLGTIPPAHAIAVFVALAVLSQRMPKRRVPPPPRSSP